MCVWGGMRGDRERERLRKGEKEREGERESTAWQLLFFLLNCSRFVTFMK